MGYTCWMDIFEMGGGDSLFDAIDKGIRNCKVVVSHVTSKYARSANCRREVSLSNALNKPIIPLLMDDTVWPPEGPMSLVFTQLLYIDFKESGTATADKLWSGQRLEQLIAKIDSHLGRTATAVSAVRPSSVKKSLPSDSQKSQPTDQKPASNDTAQEKQAKDTPQDAPLNNSTLNSKVTASTVSLKQVPAESSSSRQASAKSTTSMSKAQGARSCVVS